MRVKISQKWRLVNWGNRQLTKWPICGPNGHFDLGEIFSPNTQFFSKWPSGPNGHLTPPNGHLGRSPNAPLKDKAMATNLLPNSEADQRHAR
jgi:hypothetical protein